MLYYFASWEYWVAGEFNAERDRTRLHSVDYPIDALQDPSQFLIYRKFYKFNKRSSSYLNKILSKIEY